MLLCFNGIFAVHLVGAPLFFSRKSPGSPKTVGGGLLPIAVDQPLRLVTDIP
ncbi:hypothetical protein C4K02_4611 [Pseudomonas synxantha]|nr:hypothetical protein C4K02_4611 [Pseudomonas synxantha]